MDTLDNAVESLTFPSCGPQVEATKRSQPQWTLPKASRDDVKKVVISKKHPQDLLGKDSPGFVYNPKRQRELPKWGFGTAEARPPLGGARYPESSSNLTGTIPDPLPFKYGNSRSARIGTCPRDVITNAPDLNGFPAGAISPGPQRYHPERAPPCVRLAHAPKVDEIPPAYTMRPMTKIIESISQTGPKVGPGSYPIPSGSGPQPDRKSQPLWSICKQDRFVHKIEHGDSGRLWDAQGDQRMRYNRTFSASPSFSFGTSTRGQAQRLAPAVTTLDKGPVAQMKQMHHSHPKLAPRREIIKYTDVPSGG